MARSRDLKPIEGSAVIYRHLLLVTAVLLLASPAVAEESHVYVRSDGDASGDGRSPETAVSSLTRARDIARQLPGPRTVHLNGTFILDGPLELGPEDSGTSWVGTSGAVLTGQGKVPYAIHGSQLQDASFGGFAITDFAKQGINLVDPARVSISHLAVSRINSDAWSQGGIFVSGNIADLAITNNTVTDTGYIGIGVFSNYGQSGIRIRIADNRVEHTCKQVADCGAIYLGGRGTNSGSQITGNIVNDFGPQITKGRGIYLDDWESNVTVTNNCVAGPGLFGMHIHGGRNNKITGNRIDARGLRAALLNQANSHQPMRDMLGNVFADNVIRVDPTVSNLVEERQSRTTQTVQVSGNRIIDQAPPSGCPF